MTCQPVDFDLVLPDLPEPVLYDFGNLPVISIPFELPPAGAFCVCGKCAD